MIRFANANHQRADRWACRVAIVLEVLLAAWLTGRVAAGAAPVDIMRLAVALALSVTTVWVSVLAHGRAVLFLEPEGR